MTIRGVSPLTLCIPILACLVAPPEKNIRRRSKKCRHGSQVMSIIKLFRLIVNAEDAFLMQEVPGLRR